ncbi:phage tail assembly chaperone G [Salinicoccus roseus]|uniref:phage tail assembly chaperone G n=1 Tax=Salinicoccus roseus TaxID=45670 RepID=UPI002301FCE8|nr:hypothetical protein [Salinicoccus roseus]
MIELTLYNGDNDSRKIKRDDANLIEMEKYFELQKEVAEGIKSGKMGRIEQTQKVIAFMAFLFKEQGVSEDDLRKGLKAKEFDEVTEEIFRQISPSDYKRKDRLASESGGNKEKSK